MTMACGPGYLPILTGALGPAGLARARVEGDYFLARATQVKNVCVAI